MRNGDAEMVIGIFCQSPFLDLLFKYQCIRTQKKQKVFYWCVLFSFHPEPSPFHYSLATFLFCQSF